MRPRPLSLLVLLCLALRLGAGPHPCHGMPAPATPAASGHCHDMPAPARPAGDTGEKRDDCCDPQKGGHALCEQGCQRAAVLLVVLAGPVVQTFEEVTASAELRRSSPLAFPIDHVPLA